MKRILLVLLFLFMKRDSFAATLYFHTGMVLFQYGQEWNRYFTNQGPPVEWTDVAYFQGYVAGVASAGRSQIDLPDGAQIDQLCLIVHRYLQNNPSRLHEPASDLVITALRQRFKR